MEYPIITADWTNNPLPWAKHLLQGINAQVLNPVQPSFNLPQMQNPNWFQEQWLKTKANWQSGIGNLQNSLSNVDWSHVGNQGMNVAHSLLSGLPNKGVDNTMNSLSNDIKGIGSDLLMQSGDPYAMAAGLAIKGLQKLGGFADASNFDWKNKDGSINAQNTAMNIGNFVNSFNPFGGFVAKAKDKWGPAAGIGVAMLSPNPLTMAQAIWGDTTINYTQNPDSMSSGYSGLSTNASKMEGMDNAHLLFGVRQQNQDIMRQMNQESQVADILTQNRNLQQFGNVQGYTQQYQTRQRGGWSPYGLVAGKKGTKLDKPYLKFYNSLPSELKGIKDFNMKRYWELHDKPITFVKSNQMFYKEGGKFKPYTVAYNRDNNSYEFMGDKEKELEWYNSDNAEAVQFRNDGWIPTDVAYIQKGGKFKEWVKDINPNYLNDNYDLELAFEKLPFEKLTQWKNAVNSQNPEIELNKKDSLGNYINHLPSVVELENGDYIFLKKGTVESNPELQFEIDAYNSGELSKTHDLVFDGDRFYYKLKKIESHKEGGQMNVIPDGALHARLNNIGDDNLTRKGIPVVDNEGTQTAEVEKEEIIFTKSVTEQLEKWFKQYNESESEKEKNELAIKCGKFLTEQILYNTDDKADLINKVE